MCRAFFEPCPLSPYKRSWIGMVMAVALVLRTLSAGAHQLWIETEPSARVGRGQVVHVCWGHPDDKATGGALESQKDLLRAWVLRPDGNAESLPLAKGPESFIAKFAPEMPGYYLLGAERQGGILYRELHGIPIGTRIVMYGKAFTHIQGGSKNLQTPMGMDLEIIPLCDPKSMCPADVVTVKILFKGKPLGGKEVLVSLSTLAPQRSAQHPNVQTRQWSIEDHPDPRTGEVSFPLIVSGQHVFYAKYLDANPGAYQGDREISTAYGRLRKGETYERTLYITTLTLHVGGRGTSGRCADTQR